MGDVVLRPAGGHASVRPHPDRAADSFARLGLAPPARLGVLTNPYSLDDDLDHMEWADGEDEPGVGGDEHVDDDDDHLDVDGVDETGDAADDTTVPHLTPEGSFDVIAHRLGLETQGDRVYSMRFPSGMVRLGKARFIHVHHGESLAIKCICEQHSQPGKPCFLLLPAMGAVFDKYEAALQWLAASDRNAVDKDQHLQMASDIKAKFHVASH